MPVTTDTTTSSIDLVRECGSNARSSRLIDHGIEEEGKGEKGLEGNHSIPRKTPPLIGECHYNVLALCKELYEADFEPILVWGALHFDEPAGESDLEPPETVPEAESKGVVHFWAELEWGDDILVVDISSEIPAQFGDPYIDTELPFCYHRPENCRFRYEPERGITSNQLRNEEGYRHLIEQDLLVK